MCSIIEIRPPGSLVLTVTANCRLLFVVPNYVLTSLFEKLNLRILPVFVANKCHRYSYVSSKSEFNFVKKISNLWNLHSFISS